MVKNQVCLAGCVRCFIVVPSDGMVRSSAPTSGVLASAEKHKTNLNTVLCFLTSTNYTLPLFGLKSIESATHNLACVVPDTLSHFPDGFKSKRTSIGAWFTWRIWIADVQRGALAPLFREWAKPKILGWNGIRVQQFNSTSNQTINYYGRLLNAIGFLSFYQIESLPTSNILLNLMSSRYKIETFNSMKHWLLGQLGTSVAPFPSCLADHLTAGACFGPQPQPYLCSIVGHIFLIILVPARHHKMQLRHTRGRMKFL